MIAKADSLTSNLVLSAGNISCPRNFYAQIGAQIYVEKGGENMLTGLMFLGGMCLTLAAGAAMVEKTPVGKWIDHLAAGLPMNWVQSEHED